MVFGLDSLRDFEETLNSLGEQSNISENSSNERNNKLCKAIINLACSITLLAISQFDMVHDDLFDTLETLYAFRKELYNESTSTER